MERYKEKLGMANYQKACADNALPLGFETMDYFHFLAERRTLMAGIIKQAYERL